MLSCSHFSGRWESSTTGAGPGSTTKSSPNLRQQFDGSSRMSEARTAPCDSGHRVSESPNTARQ